MLLSKNIFLNKKLTTAQIHQLYCLWHNDTRSLLRGKKDHLLFGLITTVKNESQWLGISTPCENWYEMTPDEQYNWIETKELTNN